MQLHDGSKGTQEGFDIWSAWSQGITRVPYPGDAVLKSHWLSFSGAPSKHVATGEALAAELPAEAEDFEVVPTGTNEEQPKDPKTEERKANLDKLIERFVFVTMEQEYFDRDRNALIGDKAIKHLLTPYMPRKNGKELDPIDALMRSRQKDAVEALAFHPGEDSIFTYNKRRYANTFFDQTPTPIAPSAEQLEKIEWMFNRIDDEAYRDWLKQFYAHMVQRPGIKIRAAPLIWSRIQGNGKSTLVGTIPKLLVSEAYYVEVTSGMLNSDHNDYLIGKWHVTLAEFRAGTRGERESISVKKSKTGSPTIYYRSILRAQGPIQFQIISLSPPVTNKDDAALIDENDRKWAVHELSAPKMTAEEKEWLFTSFLRLPSAPAVLRAYFLAISLINFDPNADAPRTSAREAMIHASIAPDFELLETAFEERSEPLSRDVVITKDVGEYARHHCSVKPSNDRVGRILAAPPFNGQPRRVKVGDAQFRAIVLRNHAKWMAASGREIMDHIAGNDIDLAS